MLVPIAVHISALCGQARQLELKSDQASKRNMKVHGNGQRTPIAGSMPVWEQQDETTRLRGLQWKENAV